MADPFTNSLVYKTSPIPWHQLLVLSQSLIDDAFWNMWAISDPTSPIKTFNMTVRGGGSMAGQLDAPQISLNVTSLIPQLYYLLKFQSGTLTLYTSDDPNDPTEKEWDVSGWVLAFPVTIGSKNLDPNDPANKGYLQEMGNPQGVFSLAQLFIDASEAYNYDPAMSHFGGEDWSKENYVVRSSFATLVNRWLSLMAAQDKTLLGISLQTSEPSTVNPDAPSFPPTSLNYYMYPWLDPSVPNSTPQNMLDQNALCYMMMTNRTPPPSPPVLDYSGTWVDGSTSNGGLLVMNADQFWFDWFCPLLKFLNFATEIECTEPVAVAHGGGSIEVAPRYIMSWNSRHPDPNDSYYDFKRADDGSFYWNGDVSTSENSDTAGGSAWNKIEVNENAQARSQITFTPGGQLIKITGSNTFNFNCDQTGITSGPFTTGASFGITLNWHVNVALGVVSDGGLQISRVADPKGVDAITVVGVSSSSGIDWETPWDNYEDAIRNSMNNYFQSQLSNAENNLIYGLANQNKLFLPGSGTFLMNGAEMNARGDLIAGIHYNGAQPPGQKQQLPAYLKELPPRKPRNPHRPIPSTSGVKVEFPAAKISPKHPSTLIVNGNQRPKMGHIKLNGH